MDFEPIEVEVHSLEDLLKQGFIQRFRREPEFYRFSIDRGYLSKEVSLLMAEYEEGQRWWVVAYVQGDISPLSDLPEFEPGKEAGRPE